LGELLRQAFGERLLGPQPPVTEKIKGEWALVFLGKVPRTEPMSVVRETIRAAAATLTADPALRRVTLTVDVDPM
jgi:hypothetical protein